VVKGSCIGLEMHYISIPMAYSIISERLSSYALNRSIARWRGATETHLMDSPIDICEVYKILLLIIPYP